MRLEAHSLFQREHPTFAKILDASQDRGVKSSTPHMRPEDIERLKACSQEIAEILYRNTPESELTNLDGIEKSVRHQMLEHVSPEVALFLSKLELAQPKAEREQ